MQIIGIIPARLESTRLPRKLLLDETGKPLIQYTWEAALAAQKLEKVIIATDNEEIATKATQFGAHCVKTGVHPSGTDRIAEVVRKECPEAEIVINLQGDEPEINPQAIDQLIQTLVESPQSEMATLATPIHQRSDLENSACTKVVCTQDGRALYFSRSVIPHCRDNDLETQLMNHSPWLLHLGLYAYRRHFLLELTQQPQSPLEQLEKLEQLRALEMGAKIQVSVIEHRSVGIDTPEDYAHFVERQKN